MKNVLFRLNIKVSLEKTQKKFKPNLKKPKLKMYLTESDSKLIYVSTCRTVTYKDVSNIVMTKSEMVHKKGICELIFKTIERLLHV